MKRIAAIILFAAITGVAQAQSAVREPFLEGASALPRPTRNAAPAATSDYLSLRQSDEDRQYALAALDRQDWHGAASSFEEALRGRPCSPQLIYNAGLAHSRANETAPAALWLRAYLAMTPDADNAAEIEAEITRLAKTTEGHADALFSEAERLAMLLPNDPPSPDRRSLRQDALETLGFYGLIGGWPEDADRLLRTAQAMPGVRPERSNLAEARQTLGAFRMMWARDAAGLEHLFKSARVEDNIRLGYLAQVYINLFDQKNVERILRDLPYETFNYLKFNPLPNLRSDGYFALILPLLRAAFERASKDFNPTLFNNLTWFVSAALLRGRPDLARELAAPARRYIEQRDPFILDGITDRQRSASDHYAQYVFLLAVLADRAAIKEFAPRRYWYPADHDSLGLAALAAAATMRSADAEATIAALASAIRAHAPDYTGYSLEERVPLVLFADAVVRGNQTAALAALERLPKDHLYDSNFGSDTLFGWRAALEFAIATRREELALSIARMTPANQWELPIQMGRLLERTQSDSVRRRAQNYLEAACDGWTPSSLAQAQEVRWRIARAEQVDKFNGETKGLPPDLERLSKDSPEQIPAELAKLAMVVAAHAEAARQAR